MSYNVLMSVHMNLLAGLFYISVNLMRKMYCVSILISLFFYFNSWHLVFIVVAWFCYCIFFVENEEHFVHFLKDRIFTFYNKRDH